MSGNWEKVGKGSKQKSKIQWHQEAEKMPKQNAEAAPLPVASMFDAIDDKRKNIPGNQKQPLTDRSNIQASPRGKKQKKSKKSTPTSNFKHKHFEDAIREVSVLEVNKRATELRIGHNVWQKEIASFLNEIISCPEESPAFLKRDFSYPSSKLPKPVREMLVKLFVEETSDAIRQLLFDYLIRTLKECTAKDMPTWGYRICVQTLAHNVPDACTMDLQSQYKDILTRQSVPKRCFTILWTLGQVGVGSVQSGMRVWLEVMMPLLGAKNLAPFVVHYLATLLKSAKNPQKDLAGSIGADHFVEIMKWTFDTSNGLAPGLHNELRAMYGTVHMIATASPQLKLAVFEKFLRTPVSEISRIKAPFVEVSLECVKENTKCLKSWKESYLSSLPQTKLLLEHIDGKWEECAGKLPNKFEDTIRYFHSENSNAAAQTSPAASVPEFKTMRELCLKFLQRYEKRVHHHRSRCGGILISALVAVVAISLGLFLYDIKLHGSIKKSASYRILESSGTLKYLEQAWKMLSTVVQHIIEWLQRNVPYYWSVASDVFGPYFEYVGYGLLDLWAWIVNATADIRHQIAAYMESALAWADEMFRKLIPFVSAVYMTLRPYLLAFYAWLAAKATAILSFVRGDIGWCCVKDAVVENTLVVYHIFRDACEVTLSCFLQLGKLASDYVSGENM